MKQKFFLWISLLLFALFSGSAYGQGSTVTGTVTDDSGVPMPGVNVIVKGTQRGVSTDFDGNLASILRQAKFWCLRMSVLKQLRRL